MVLFAGTVLAADFAPKGQITSAAGKLGDKANYSWKMTFVVPEGSQFRRGPTEGQTEKSGYTHLTMNFGENKTEAVLKGDKAVVTNPEGGWLSLADLDNGEGPARFFAGLLRSFKAPAAQAAELAAGTKELKKDGDAISGDLTEDNAKSLLMFRRAGNDAPQASNAKGWVKFWIKDGLLSKYEFKVTGKVSFNGNDRDVDRTTTVEIKDVDTTKVQVPEDAKKKLS